MLLLEQFIGDGATVFITIIACIVAFGAAMATLDMGKTKKQNEINEINNENSRPSK